MRIVEYIFTIVSLLFYSGGPLPVILSGGRGDGLATAPPDFALVKICFQLIYITTLFYLAPHWKRAAYLLVKDKLILLLMIVIFLSIFWSVDVERTVARSVAVFGTTLFGIYFAIRYSLKQQLHILGWVLGLAGIMSILFAVALPQYGIMRGIHAGAWRGIFTHKNGLGAMMALSVVTFLTLDASDRKNSFIFRLGIFVSIVLLLLSKSSSPLIYLTVLTAIFFLSRVLRWEYKLKATAISIIVMLGYASVVFCISQAEAIANMFGKDLTFTGRTDLWVYAWELIEKKPWLGYGYGALWSGLNSETGHIWRILGWEPPNAHNGFLDVWLSLGILGLSMLVIHIFITFIRAVVIIGQGKTAVCFLPLIVMLLILLKNVTETNFIDRNSIDWVLYVSIALSLHFKSNIVENTLSLSSLHSDGERSASTCNTT